MQLCKGFLIPVFVCLFLAQTTGAPVATVTVNANDVNLRSKPSPSGEVVVQVSKGATLISLEEKDEWVRVAPPPDVDFWVYRLLVRDGVTAASQVQVRCGPGINYTAVGVLDRGVPVESRGEFNDWIKIAPPDGSSLWINSAYVKSANATRPVAVKKGVNLAVNPEPETARTPAFREISVEEPSLPVSPGPVGRDVAAAPRSGFSSSKPVTAELSPGVSGLREQPAAPEPGEYSGLLRRSNIVWRRFGRYRLVATHTTGREVTVCSLVGQEDALSERVDTSIRVLGRLSSRQGTKWPIVEVLSILPDAPGSPQASASPSE